MAAECENSTEDMDMAIDEALLEAHASHRDQRLGISEEFIRIEAGTGRTLGVLALPMGERKPLGWMVCHSPLRPTFTGIANSLTSAFQRYDTLPSLS